jgi:hypothetical protein
MNKYVITASLPCAGSAEGFSYRLEVGPDPSGYGFVLALIVDHVGPSFRTAIALANTAAELDRQVRMIGITASGEAQIALDDLVRRGLAKLR